MHIACLIILNYNKTEVKLISRKLVSFDMTVMQYSIQLRSQYAGVAKLGVQREYRKNPMGVQTV